MKQHGFGVWIMITKGLLIYKKNNEEQYKSPVSRVEAVISITALEKYAFNSKFHIIFHSVIGKEQRQTRPVTAVCLKSPDCFKFWYSKFTLPRLLYTESKESCYKPNWRNQTIGFTNHSQGQEILIIYFVLHAERTLMEFQIHKCKDHSLVNNN